MEDATKSLAVEPVQQSLTERGNDPAVVAAAQAMKTRREAAFVMAKQFPRDEDHCRRKILNMCRRPHFAANAIYRKPQGGGFIEGPSVRFAEGCLNAWGNLTVETSIVFEDLNVRRLMVSVIDLETNSQFGREVVISKTIERRNARGRQIMGERTNSTGQTVFIVAATADELMIKESAAVSKAVRNEGLRCIPPDIREEALMAVHNTQHGEFKESPEAARKRLLDAFDEVKVTEKMLAEYLGHGTDEISQFEFADLRKVYSALNQEHTNWNRVMEVRREKFENNESPAAPKNGDQKDEDPTKGAK